MLRIFKEVSALPATLQADAIYIVRVGEGFDIYVTNGDGIPFALNFADGGGGTPGVIPSTLPNPFVSARLGPMYGLSARPFINHFKLSAPWQGDGNNASWDTLVAGGFLTPGGAVLSIQSGSNGYRTRLFDRMVAGSGVSGRWRLAWTGTATWDLYGAASVNRDVPNQITFDFTADGNSWIDVVCRTVGAGGASGFSLVHEDDWDKFDAGQIYRDEYLAAVRNYRVLRFDEWVGILRSEAEGGLRIDTWASRGLPTDEIFYRFIPYEYMTDLCNLVGADMWFCHPTAVDNNHMEQAAELIRSRMPAPRHVYAELSTKTWDFAGTPQAHFFADNGRIAFGTEANPTQAEFMNYYAMRATEMALIWRDVWGADPRLHTVIQHQADVVGAEVDILVAPMWQERNGTLGLPPYVAPHSVIDMFTVHAQIDGGLAYHNNDALIETWRTTLTQTEAFNRLRDQMLDARYYIDPEWADSNRNVANMTTKWQHYKDVCDGYGMEFGIYEVGSHLNGVGNSQAMYDFMAAFSVSPQIGEVYTAIFEALQTIGLDGPLCMSVECRFPDQNTAHGLQRWIGDENPAWQAVTAFNTTNVGPAGRGALDFVGTIELDGTSGPAPVDLTPILTRLDALETIDAETRLEALETAEPEPLKTVGGQNIRGTGNVEIATSRTTDSAAAAYSTANPGVIVFSTQAS